MSTLLVTHPTCLDHDTGHGHPERPDRIRALNKVFSQERFSSLIRKEAPMGLDQDILRAHPQTHVDRVKQSIPQSEYNFIDGDTLLSPMSLEPIYRAVGAGILAVDEVMENRAKNAFCSMRPPGHHAERTRAMGFCFFNNIAIAAFYAKEKYGCERIAVIDFDVHHGNGTQDIFWKEPNMFYGSTHQMPLFPGTGHPSEKGEGNIVNVPLQSGADGNFYRTITQEELLEPLKQFSPDMLFISAGFDAHTRDPLSTINLSADDFEWITQKLMEVADISCSGRVISMLEGGYDLLGLTESASAHVECLMQS